LKTITHARRRAMKATTVDAHCVPRFSYILDAKRGNTAPKRDRTTAAAAKAVAADHIYTSTM
jgi:hypothetical protein